MVSFKQDATTETAGAIREVDELLDHLEEWNAPKKMETPANFTTEDDVFLVPEPLGVALVIAPWNFPLITSTPFASALAAGNTVILKLSEFAPTFSSLFAGLVSKYFDKRLFAAVEGAVPETTALLEERFDHITYTGNPTVARVIMTAAAKNLTPVTLELGGKNPVLVEPDADLEDAAKKIVYSKTMNCGQICLSSDYVLTTQEVKPKLIDALAKAFDAMAPIKENKAFARIVNERHFDRLSSLLSKTKGKIAYKADGELDRKDKFIPPHVIEIDKDDEFMKEEIFGPFLPILTVKSFDESLEFVKDHEKPLGAYLFTKDAEKTKRFLRETSSGGVTVNDVMTHAWVSNVPFGGVGNSGMGATGSKFGFDNIVHYKPILIRRGVGKEVANKL
ncbi:aldehyde dehydrogenase family protein [Oesophagostomum dentatum]|uniref:Aldehyde dehydrogenase family protein n=1 Tax=Oesophagostomum dentatum TaxID=61180 RepID=A0A0B1SSQ8_OESDE|nr:aldehyde dehydrogenase family protein [Oesophagostomum dentatum]